MSDERMLYDDNPCAPIVHFLNSDSNTDDEDMTDSQKSSFISTNLEQSLKACSLEDLVKSFDNTISTCCSNQLIIESPEAIPAIPTNSPVKAKTWSDLIENLRASLYRDLKLSPHLNKTCQRPMNNIHENELTSIDDLDEDEQKQLDMYAAMDSNHEQFLTAEQVIDEIDSILKDMTPDSGYGDDLNISYANNKIKNKSFLKHQTIDSLNEINEDLNGSIKNLSNTLVQELALRDELEYEKELKNTFISLVLNIEKKRQQYQNNKHQSVRNISIQSGTYLTTTIPFDRYHPTYLSIEHFENLNKILYAINEDSVRVSDLLTNYILKVLCH